MLFNIAHELDYRYSRAVFLGPHTFYLRPREDGSQRIESFSISIIPQPLLQTWTTDLFGNVAFRAWFGGKHDSLKIVTQVAVESSLHNPFSYIPEEGCLELPVHYSRPLSAYLGLYLEEDDGALSFAIRNFTERVSVRSGTQTTSFLPCLCRTIHREFKSVIRREGACFSPDETLAQKQGACRDLAMLFIACCKTQKLAARFVSGYFVGDSEKSHKDLHAWAEVYVEGGGWRGFDPSTGLAVNENYVPLAASPAPELISPSIGTFRGNLVQSELHATIEMRGIETEAMNQKPEPSVSGQL